MGRLQDKHNELNRVDPFSSNENMFLDRREKAFIRDIQIVNQCTKKKALTIFRVNKNKSKASLKALGKKVRKRLEHYGYGKSGKNGDTTTKYKPPKKVKGVKIPQTKKKEVKDYLENPENQKDKTYSRVIENAKKYPNDSLYELRHGHNSLASQQYRKREESRLNRERFIGKTQKPVEGKGRGAKNAKQKS